MNRYVLVNTEVKKTIFIMYSGERMNEHVYLPFSYHSKVIRLKLFAT